MNITAVIVDDEKPSREVLANYLREYCPGIQVIAECRSANTAFKAISELHPQLVFLDVEMPKGNGFDLLRMFGTVNFKVIFITAFSNYAVQAFRFSAVDFLLKPLKISELTEAVHKAQNELSAKDSFLTIKTLLENLSGKSSPNGNLVVSNSKGFSVLKTSDIIFCEADGYCTIFHLAGKGKMSSSRNLKYFEELLPNDQFIRTHHSFIVNLQHVTGYSHLGEIYLTDDHSCSLSAAHKNRFMGYFKHK